MTYTSYVMKSPTFIQSLITYELSQFGDDAIDPLLRTLKVHKDTWIISGILETLSSIDTNDARLVEPVIDFIDYQDGMVRASAVRALVAIYFRTKDKRIPEILIFVSSDPDERVRSALGTHDWVQIKGLESR